MSLSLWFIPPKGNSFEKTAQELISETIPNIFFTPDQIQQKNHHTFPPHVTITSGIQFPSSSSSSSSSSDGTNTNTNTSTSTSPSPSPSPQEWLDSLDCSAYQSQHNPVNLELDAVHAEDAFFRKCHLKLKENANLMAFASLCRRHAGGFSSSDDDNATTTEEEENEKEKEGNEEKKEEEKEEKKEEEEKYRPHLSLLYADLPTSTIASKLPLIEMKVGFAIGDLFACCGGALCIGGRMVLVDTGSKAIGEWKDAYVAERETPFVQWRITRNLV